MKCTYNLVYNHTGKLNRQGKSLIQIRIYQNLGHKIAHKFISTGIKIEPSQWDRKKRKIKKHPNAINLNVQIKKQIAELENFELQILNSGKEFNIKMFNDFLKGRYTNSVIEFIKMELQDIEKNKSHKKQSLQTLKASFSHVRYFRKDILFNELDFALIQDFDRYLKRKKISQNTVYRIHKQFKYFLNIAIKKGFLEMQKNPYNFFKSKLVETHRTHLLPSEIEIIEKFVFNAKNKYLEKIRDYFMFLFYSGLRYDDFIHLKKSDIQTDDKINYFIKLIPEKTRTTSNKTVYIPLKFNNKPLEIIKKYKKEDSEYLFKDYTNQYFNRELKKIAVLCGITKTVTCHVARHSFATYLLYKNVPINIVSKLLGHSSIRTTEIYAKTLNVSIDNNLNKIDYNF